MIYEFTPTQDLHGYGKPWAPGAGKNKLLDILLDDAPSISYKDVTLSIEDQKFKFNGTATGAGGRLVLRTDVFTLTAGDYYLSYSPIATQRPVPIVHDASNDSPLKTDIGSFTLAADTEVYVGFNIDIGYVFNNSIFAFQIESGSSSTAWNPYENICPPEGYNIWDPLNDQFVQVYAGYVNSNTRELYLRPVYSEYAGEELVGPWMSSLDEYSEDATPTEGAFVIDFGGELESFEITPFMLQTLLDSLGIRQHFTDGAGLLNSLMDQAQGRVRSEEELLHLSRPLKVIAIGDQLPAGITFKPISKDVLPGLPGKFIR